jgi:hypothetical protein
MKKFFLAALAAFSLVAAPKNTQGGVSVPITASKWQLWNRAVNRLPIYSVTGGIGFNFEVSQLPDPNAGPTWDGYFVTPVKNVSLTGSEIVVTFQINASSTGVQWNFKSDSFNGGNAPANFHVYVQTKEGSGGSCKELFSICNPPQLRWWSNPVSFTLTDTGGIIELHVPVTPENWSETDGVQATDPVFYPYWVQTMANPKWVGITFGGGSFFGHGVNVTLDPGTPVPTFTLLGWEVR